LAEWLTNGAAVRKPQTLPAFTREEREKAQELLAARVATMMGRKLEEGDWIHVYCSAKGIPVVGWSNLNIDVRYRNIGIEEKMLRQPATTRLVDVCGKRLMHPSATRSIRINPESEPNAAMRDVLTQYAEFLNRRSRKVAEAFPGYEPDMRTAWLLWKPTLDEFLYFEEETIRPNPDDYVAEWHATLGRGARKPSKSLWIYEKDTGQKVFSITTSAGAKIQPYFDVPLVNDPNLYIFTVQGEEPEPGVIRVWLTVSTVRELRRLIGDLTPSNVMLAIESAANDLSRVNAIPTQHDDEAVALNIPLEAYELLNASFPGESDEHTFRLMVQHLQRTAG
jgi:hypothetical protein